MLAKNLCMSELTHQTRYILESKNFQINSEFCRMNSDTNSDRIPVRSQPTTSIIVDENPELKIRKTTTAQFF